MDKPPWSYIGIGRVTLNDPRTEVRTEYHFYIRELPEAGYGIDGTHIYVSVKIPSAKRRRFIANALQLKNDQEKWLKSIGRLHNSRLGSLPIPVITRSEAEQGK